MMKYREEKPGISRDSLHGRFEQQAQRWPQRIALSFRDQHLSYQQLDERANKYAKQLRIDGVLPGDLVALMLPRSIDLVVHLLAVLKVGAGYVPIDPNYPAERVEWMIESSAPALLLTQPDLCEQLWKSSPPKFIRNRIRWIENDDAIHSSNAETVTSSLNAVHSKTAPETDSKNNRAGLDVAYIIFTSGSTGKPKGVMVGHQQVMYLLDAVIPRMHCDHTDVWTLFHSLAFDFSVWELWGALTTGARLCIVPQDIAWSADSFTNLLRNEQVTILNQTPSAFYALTQAVEQTRIQGALSLRCVIFGGEALNLHQLTRWWANHPVGQPRLINMYGITETTVHVTWLELTPELVEMEGSPIGEAIPGLDVYLLDHALNPVADGEPGEIHVGGRQLALGYLGRPDLTASRFIANPTRAGERLYRSGDLAIRRGDQLFYLGRADRQLKVRGFRIEPAEIETAIETHPAVQRCAVLAQPPKECQVSEGLLAFLVVKAGTTALPDSTGLRHYLAERLPVHCLPSAYLFVDALPLTINGKLDQAALIRQWQRKQHTNDTQQRRLDLLRARMADNSAMSQ